MTRKEVKRLLALLKARSEYPDRVIDLELPAGFKESFESQPAFRGWLNYHETWDVDADDVWVVVTRRISLVAEWAAELARVVPVIEPDGTVVTAAEWERRQKDGGKGHIQ